MLLRYRIVGFIFLFFWFFDFLGNWYRIFVVYHRMRLNWRNLCWGSAACGFSSGDNGCICCNISQLHAQLRLQNWNLMFACWHLRRRKCCFVQCCIYKDYCQVWKLLSFYSKRIFWCICFYRGGNDSSTAWCFLSFIHAYRIMAVTAAWNGKVEMASYTMITRFANGGRTRRKLYYLLDLGSSSMIFCQKVARLTILPSWHVYGWQPCLYRISGDWSSISNPFLSINKC